MVKRLFCFLLSLGLVLSLALPALAEESPETPTWRAVRIRSEGQLLTLAENCRLDSYSRSLQVYLEEDLDLTGLDFAPIPIFCGIFQGQGHSITGLDLTGEGSYQGLFRYLTETAQVQDLHLSGTVSPGGSASFAGSLAGQNRGLIKNCSFTGSVSGNSAAGGLVGENALTGIVENCQVQGFVTGSHFVGGIAGKNSGVIRSCVSRAQVNTTSQENTVELTEIQLENLLSSESASTVTDIGGIAGLSTGVIRSCVNHADVGYRHMGYNIGGIAGTQSGLVADSVNRGQIQGRKEVGGIVGQMEPAALVAFDQDALQILQGQLAGMSNTVNKTAANVQDSGSALGIQVALLGDHVVDAADAVSLLIPERKDDTWVMPDEDTVTAARNSLSGSIAGMTGVLSGMSATTNSAVGKLSNNLHALQNQINAMAATMDNMSETLGGSIRDMSDLDTDDELTGKVLRCQNFGAVLADINAGGIAGAMALENDLDAGEDWNIQGSSSLNFESQLRAVIDKCKNEADITAGKRAAGGITGWQSLGLVRSSINTGSLSCEGAQYVGGISGQSTGFIRNCSTKCILTGAEFLGGIAGSGCVVTDCVAMADLQGAQERRGAILGSTEEDRSETETPTAGNHYLRLDRDPGGIDGISYDGIAQGLEAEAFFRDSRVPASFRDAKVTFLYADGRTEVFQVKAGGQLEEEKIPPLPEPEDSQNRWDGLQDADLSRIFFDITFREVRHRLRTVLESDTKAENGRPVLLARGIFPDSAQLSADPSGLTPPLEAGQTLLGAWVLRSTHPDSTHTLHLRLPEDCDKDKLTLRIHRGSGWQEHAFTADGSYLVFSAEDGLDAVALLEEAAFPWQYPAMIGGAAVLAVLAFILIRRKKKT